MGLLDRTGTKHTISYRPFIRLIIDCLMVRITFHFSKKEGIVRVKYRLRTGDDKIQICHKSDIRCDYKEVIQFESNGFPKARFRHFNAELSEKLQEEYRIMYTAFAKMCDEGKDMTTEVFEREIAAIKNPVVEVRLTKPDIVSRFRKYANDAFCAGILGKQRFQHIIVVSDKLERFLIINGIRGLTVEEFDVEHLMRFREFLFDEYLYVMKYPALYQALTEKKKIVGRLSMNTVTTQMKMFQTFFTELEDLDEIRKSPFRRLGRERKKTFMKTKYDVPVFLRKKELMKILETKVGPALQETKDAFLVQCAFGCRISDYMQLTLDSIAVSDEGIPYIHYLPQKTAEAQETNGEVETPIVRYAYDIIMRTGFEFPILKNIYGHGGYNVHIRALLQHCGINRPVAQYNEETRRNEYVPLYSVGSSKLARKTHVDMMNKVQVDMYAAGLHKVGSSAVARYTSMELVDRFKLMNAAFGQEDYRVDDLLMVIK